MLVIGHKKLSCAVSIIVIVALKVPLQGGFVHIKNFLF